MPQVVCHQGIVFALKSLGQKDSVDLARAKDVTVSERVERAIRSNGVFVESSV
ncbi:MAG: hypothetical protein JNK90_08315 [Planctomycetaceae bacterium]|nr:hypothetical protein [Planctomycetaceae bacterium]MBN8603014.1 hypothetical protein [Planctomycetota bacterium]